MITYNIFKDCSYTVANGFTRLLWKKQWFAQLKRHALESHFLHSLPQTAQCSSCLFAENFIIVDNYVYWRRKHQIPLCQHQELPGLILHIHIYIKCTSGSWASYIIYIYYTQKPLIVRFLKKYNLLWRKLRIISILQTKEKRSRVDWK